jgi:superkiller protein 3
MASAYYQAAIACHKQNQYPEAMQYFQKACAADPGLAEAYNGLGVTLAVMGNHADAVQCFSKAWQVDNSLAVVQRNWASSLVSMGQFDEAIKHYQESVGVTTRVLSAKDRALVYNDWAVNLFRVNRSDEAAEKLVYAVDVDPTLFDAHMNLGLVRSALHEYEMASEAFEKALVLFPDHQDLTMQLAISYLLSGRNVDALELMTKLAGKGYKNAEFSYWLGYANLAQGNTTAAAQNFEAALFQNQQNYLAMDAIGCCLMLENRHAEALARFEQSVSINPRYALGHLHLARSLETTNQNDRANQEYKIALSLDPNCLAAEKEVIEGLLKASQFELAMNRSLKLLEISPMDPDATLSLAKVLKSQNRLNEAQELLERTLVQSPDNGPAHVLAGQIYLSQGRFLDADEKFRVASELFEGDCTLYYSWGRSLVLLGFHELALEKFQKASEIDPYDADVYDAWGAALKHLGKFGEAAEVFKRASEYM